MRVKTTFAAFALAALLTALWAGPANAGVIKVGPGESIQAAIDQADPGDTIKLAPGTYQQNVQIKKDGITLKGAGARDTILQGGGTATPVDPVCGGEAGGFSGICVADATVSDTGPPVPNREIADVEIKGLTVKGFEGDGVFFFGTRDQRVSHVIADGNGGYGIVAFDTTGGRYWGNVTSGNHEAGIYVGDSPEANAVVRDNVSYANVGFGIFVRDAAHGVVAENETFDNCVGILFLDTPEDPSAPAPHPASDWNAWGNSANHNNAFCPPSEDDPTGTSGLGIVIASAHRITLAGNTANGNVPSGDSLASGGIVVVTLPGPTPETTPAATDNVVKFNSAFGNSPVDLLWDGQGDNAFTGNRCETSNPDGLCTSGGQGHHGHHGDHGGHGHHGDHGGHGHHGDHGSHGHHGDHGSHGGKGDHGHHGHHGHHKGHGHHGKHHRHGGHGKHHRD
jgi:Right handed beta helix region